MYEIVTGWNVEYECKFIVASLDFEKVVLIRNCFEYTDHGHNISGNRKDKWEENPWRDTERYLNH